MKLLLALVLVLAFATSAAAVEERYDPRGAGHPLRVAAYVAHPVGVILDTLIFHPAWWISCHEPIRTLVGREPMPLPESLPDLEPTPENTPEP